MTKKIKDENERSNVFRQQTGTFNGDGFFKADVFKDDESYFVKRTTFKTVKYVTKQDKDSLRK